jgi:hypothetical protein
MVFKLALAIGFVFLLSTLSFGQATYQDNDPIQYGKADSTITVDTSFQLWLFIKSPKDTAFQSIHRVLQNRQFTVVSDTSTKVNAWRNDTLFLPIGTKTVVPDSVFLNWTAPGDDGNVGTAAEYDARRSNVMITNATWASNTQFTGEPTPKIAGTQEKWKLPVLPNGTYYIAIKARDEAMNWSGLSNVINLTLGQTVPDSSFSYLMFTSWNKWDGANWTTGAQGPKVTVVVSSVILPQGASVVISPDAP